MGGVMLTCQRTNAAAMKFYEQCKYTVDNISPMKVVRPTLLRPLCIVASEA